MADQYFEASIAMCLPTRLSTLIRHCEVAMASTAQRLV